MLSNICIISEGLVFLTDALSKNLQQAGFKVNVVGPTIKEVDKYRAQTDIFLVYAGDFISECSGLFVFLKTVCSQDEKKLCIVGYPQEIEAVENIVTADAVSLSVERPFDMKEMISNVKKLRLADVERKIGKHILLVDDDLAYLKMVQEWLSSRYRVTAARSGMQAIKYIAGHNPDLILLDYEMPITSGPQVMEMIRSDPDSASIPIIFLTGKSDKESVMSVMALKPQGYMLKSLPKEQILATIDNFFRTKTWNT